MRRMEKIARNFRYAKATIGETIGAGVDGVKRGKAKLKEAVSEAKAGAKRGADKARNAMPRAEQAASSVKPYIKGGVDAVKPHIDKHRASLERKAEDGIAYAINHKGDVRKYAGRAAKGAVMVAKKSKKATVAVGTGMAIAGLVLACKRSMDKAKREELRQAAKAQPSSTE